MAIHRIFIKLILIILPFGLSQYSHSEHLIHQQDSIPLKKKFTRFRLYPIISYAPETKLALGALSILLFKSGNDSTVRTSKIDMGIVYTTKRQFTVDPTFQIITKKERYAIKGSLIYTKFPEYFYGIGNTTPLEGKERISSETFRFSGKFLRRIIPFLFTGVQYQYANVFNIEFEPASIYRYSVIPGKGGSICSGAGISVIFDNRNNMFTPKSGMYLEFSNNYFLKTFGSVFQYHNYTIDLRYYTSLQQKFTLANQFLMNFNKGNVPFKQMPALGGPSIMRGFYNGRYRDKQLFVFQTEVRHHVFWRLGYTIFANIGNVSSYLEKSDVKSVKMTYGFGLRFKLLEKEDINLRFDFGFGKQSKGFYVTLAEAF